VLTGRRRAAARRAAAAVVRAARLKRDVEREAQPRQLMVE